MRLLGRRKAGEFSRKETFESRPIKNPAAKAERIGDGVRITFRADESKRSLIRRIVSLRPSTRKFELDAIGTFVWEMCDGKHTTAQIADALAEERKLNRREAEAALLSYLETLAERGVIGVQVEKDPQHEKGS